ncbi:MAG: hypothetical protein IJJ45_06965, partial [Clostridia bacterium]|nr:hypothetical protein [Clostridia bacterium]
MTKVRVQDVTKELSANAGRMLENVTRMRKQSQDMLNSLRRITDGFIREERERQEREAKEELQRQYAASASFMTAYSSEQVPEIPAEPEVKPQPAAESRAEAPVSDQPAPVVQEPEKRPAPVRPAAPAPRAPQPGVAPRQPIQRPAGGFGR